MAYVQQNSAGYTGAASQVLTFPTNVTAGSLLIAVGAFNSTGTRSVSDGTNTWHQIATNAGATEILNVWYCFNAAAGVNAITFSAGVGVGGGIAILEYNNVISGGNPSDGTPGVGSFSISASPTQSTTTTNAIDLLIGILSEFSNTAISTPGNGWNVRLNTGFEIIVCDSFVTTSGSKTFNPTLVGNESGGILIAGFQRTIDPVTKLYIQSSQIRPAFFKPGLSR